MPIGRPPKNPEIKKLSGTYKPHKAVEGPLLTKVPKPPEELNEEVKGLFKNACSILIAKKMLHPEDIHLVVIWSQEYWTYLSAAKELQSPEDHILTTASGYKQPSPWVNIRNTAQKSVREVGSLIGLDPFSRERMGVKAETKTEYQEFMEEHTRELEITTQAEKREKELLEWREKASKRYEELKKSPEKGGLN